MATRQGWFKPFNSKDVPTDFGVSVIAGTSLTIPGQGSDLAQIIASIVKLPPLDARTFDSPGDNVDERALLIKAEQDSLYGPTARNLAEDAQERVKERAAAKKAEAEADAKEQSDAKENEA